MQENIRRPDNNIGLYYPNLHFPDDGWMKLAALYWDKLGRIATPHFINNDSRTVKKLSDDLDFIEDFYPNEKDFDVLGDIFLELIQKYINELQHPYNLHMHPLKETELADVYLSKMSYRVSNALTSLGFAIPTYSGSIKMHPKLAFIYMEALGRRMARRRQLYPITNDMDAHIAINEYTMEQIAHALLGNNIIKPQNSTPRFSQYAIEEALATIAFEAVIPNNIKDIPVEKIIQLRKKYGQEFNAFQQYIRNFTASLNDIQYIEDRVALEAHLDTAYKKELQQQLEELRKCMHSLSISTATSIIDMQVIAPPFLASAISAFHISTINPIVTGSGAVAFSALKVLQKRRAEARKTVRKNPVAYLLYLEEGITPSNYITRLLKKTRQITYGV
ncbi:hypothetical protein KSC_039910 [Ktedonobacter sp. SOSP1-52]|uniref:DUF6236 family protein n=1 Tax=Ktedonobacter sp. SOSP1-52 TaxID=2778366 RepID=UPI0019158A6C|nr:DUF6236 family protein [Ktedonobacter sp. SOSP1-52]GHO65099.1 hypothetical protein KSC_039910 [Ktedonobacter sp. SOSP1-52]